MIDVRLSTFLSNSSLELIRVAGDSQLRWALSMVLNSTKSMLRKSWKGGEEVLAMGSSMMVMMGR